MLRISEVFVCGRMNSQLGSRASIATTAVPRSCFSYLCSVLKQPSVIAKGNRSAIIIKRPYISVVGTIPKKRMGEAMDNAKVVLPKIWTAVSTPLHSCRPFNKSDLPGE